MIQQSTFVQRFECMNDADSERVLIYNVVLNSLTIGVIHTPCRGHRALSLLNSPHSFASPTTLPQPCPGRLLYEHSLETCALTTSFQVSSHLVSVLSLLSQPFPRLSSTPCLTAHHLSLPSLPQTSSSRILIRQHNGRIQPLQQCCTV
jgi:hypothetical protein